MSDETQKTDVAQQGNQPPEGGEKLIPQSELDRIIQDRLARERAKYQDYDGLKSELEKLRQAEKQRQEKQAAEQGKWQEIAQQKEAEIAELNKYREKYTAWEQAESERIEKAMDGLTDEQKELVTVLPLERRMSAVNQFRAAADARNGLPAGKGQKIEGAPTLEDVQKVKAEFGAFHPRYREVMKKYLDSQKR